MVKFSFFGFKTVLKDFSKKQLVVLGTVIYFSKTYVSIVQNKNSLMTKDTSMRKVQCKAMRPIIKMSRENWPKKLLFESRIFVT